MTHFRLLRMTFNSLWSNHASGFSMEHTRYIYECWIESRLVEIDKKHVLLNKISDDSAWPVFVKTSDIFRRINDVNDILYYFL